MAQKFPFPRGRANTDFPFNPFPRDSKGKSAPTGDPSDPARYVLQPGVDFEQPWLAVPKGPAFIWPLGTEGVSGHITPVVGIHRYIGSKKVDTDVVHIGDEHVTMSGTFPGNTAAANMRALRNVVNAVEPREGKVLGLPGILAVALRVTVTDFAWSRDEQARGDDFTYTIEMVIKGGINGPLDDITPADLVGNGAAANKGTPPNTFLVTATANTLRKIALIIYNDNNKWKDLYTKNKSLFKAVPMANVPTKVLAQGTKIFY